MAFAELTLARVGGYDPKTLTIMNTTASQGVYRLAYDTFSPPVSLRRRDLLRVDVPFHSFEWELVLNIHGSSASQVYSALDDLLNVLHSAKETDSDYEGQVRVAYKPYGSALASTPYCIVTEFLGVDLPATFDDTGSTYVLLGVVVRFRTIGNYFSAAAPVSLTPTAQPSLTKQTTAHTAVVNDSVYDRGIVFASATANTTASLYTARLFSTNDTDKLHLLPAMTGGVRYSTDWSSYNDSASYAPYNVARFTPTSGALSTWQPGYKQVTTYVNFKLPRMHTWVLYRNNSATAQFKMRLTEEPQFATKTVPVILPYTGSVNLQYLGVYSTPVASSNKGFMYECMVNTLSGSPTLDVLGFVVMADDEYSSFSEFTDTNNNNIAGLTIDLKTNIIGDRNPHTRYTTLGYDFYLPLKGEYFPYTKGSNLTSLIVMPRGNFWRFYRSAPDNVVLNMQFKATIYPAYPSPR